MGLGDWEERVTAEPGAERRVQEVEQELPRAVGLAPIRSFIAEEFNEMLRDSPPPTDDDVSITTDGRRLDSKEAVVAFFAELDAEFPRE